MRLLVLVGLALLASACSLPRDAAQDRDHHSTHDAIAGAWREHIAAAVAKDVPGVVAMYADEMLYVVPGQQEVRGREDLEAMERATLAELDVIAATHTIHDLSVFGDVAYEISTVEGPVRAKGGETAVFAFHFMGMWVREEDGAWRMRALVGLPDDEVPAEGDGPEV